MSKSISDEFVMSEVNAPPETQVLFIRTKHKDSKGQELLTIAKVSDIEAYLERERVEARIDELKTGYGHTTAILCAGNTRELLDKRYADRLAQLKKGKE